MLALGFALALCVPFRPYALALRAAEHVSARTLLLLTGLLMLTGLLVYPAFGSDLFVYLDYERLWVVHGVNPLLAAPAMHPEDWAYAFTWIPQQPSPYGPLWPILTWPIAALAGEQLWGYIGGYKLLSVLSYVTCCGLVWASAPDGQRKRQLVLFAWSPLVLFEVLGKAHNDALLAVSALGAICLARRDQPVLALLVATAGALIKVSGLAVVLALVAWLAHQRRWRDLALGLAGSAVLSTALYAPFWVGPQSLLPIVVQTSRVVWSPGSLLVMLTGDTAARLILVVGFAALYLALVRRARPLPLQSALLLLATLLLLTTAFFAHYLVPVVALAAVAGNRRLEHVTLALSLGSLAAYSVELLAVVFPMGWIGSPGYQVLGSLITLAPAVVTDRCHASGWLRRRD